MPAKNIRATSLDRYGRVTGDQLRLSDLAGEAARDTYDGYVGPFDLHFNDEFNELFTSGPAHREIRIDDDHFDGFDTSSADDPYEFDSYLNNDPYDHYDDVFDPHYA